MDNLTEALVLEILSRLDDPADVARCRLAWKTFDTLSPYLRSINLQWPLQRYIESRSRVSSSLSSSQSTSPPKKIFLKLVSNLKVVESLRIGVENLPLSLLREDDEDSDDEDSYDVDSDDDMYLTDENFVKEWLPRVAGVLKSLSIYDFWAQSFWRRSNVLSLVSAYCQNLVELEFKNTRLSVHKLNPMPMLTSLTLEFILLDDKNLSELNKCFPNLEVLNLIDVKGLQQPKIHFLNLKTCHWTIPDAPSSLTLITPNLITLRLERIRETAVYIEAPLLSHFHLTVDHLGIFIVKKFKNLKTLWLESTHILSVLVKFPLTETLENLTIDSQDWVAGPVYFTRFSLEKLFSVFPCVTSLCFNASAWYEFMARYKPFDRMVWDARNGLKTFRGYFFMIHYLDSCSSICAVLDQCVNVVDVSLFIHNSDVDADEAKSFICWCMTCWPEKNWRWGIWEEGKEDSWMTNDMVKDCLLRTCEWNLDP